MDEAEKPRKSKFKNIILASVLILIVVIGVVIFKNRGTAYYAEPKKVTEISDGIKLSIPENWTTSESDDQKTEFIPNSNQNQHSDNNSTSHVEGASATHIAVISYGEFTSDWSELSNLTKKKIVDTLLQDAKNGLEDFGFTNPTTTTINGIYGIYGETKETSSHYTTEMKGLAFVSIGPDGVVRKFVAIVPEKDFNSNVLNMQKMIESISYATETTES